MLLLCLPNRILSSAVLQSIVSIHVQVCIAVSALLGGGAHLDRTWWRRKKRILLVAQGDAGWEEEKSKEILIPEVV